MTLTYQVVDDCGNISEDYITTLTIEDTTAPEIVITHPVFAGVEDGGIVEVECYSVDPSWVYPVLTKAGVEVYDACSSVEFTVEETFRNNGDCKTDGYLAQHFYKVTAIDDCGNQTILEFEMRVVDKTAPVIVGVPDDITVDCYNIPVPSIGGCNSNLTADIYAIDDCECATLAFEEIISNKTCEYNFDVLRRWTATDNCGNVTIEEQRIFVRDQNGPSFVFHEPVLNTIPNGSVYYHECSNGGFPEWARYLNSKIVTAEDGCSGEAQVSFAKSEDRSASYCENGLLEKWDYKWSATDLCGNESIYSFSIAIVDRTGPHIVGETDICTTDESGYPVAVDACSDVTDMFFHDRNIIDECGREIIERTWVAYDLCNNESVFIQKIILGETGINFFVKDGLLPAGFVNGDIIKISCDEEYRMEPFRRNGVVTGDSECTENLKLHFETQSIKEKECQDGYAMIHRFIWYGVDECGNKNEFVVNFGVVDTKPPYFYNNSSSLTLSCGDDIPSINVSDGCSDVFLILARQDTVFVSEYCGRNFALNQVYEAYDACGNKATFERHISFADEIAPVFVNPQFVGCYDTATNPLVVDDCEGVAENLEYLDSQMLNDACGIYEYIQRRWVATDQCGNTAEMTQNLLVNYNFDLLQINNSFLGKMAHSSETFLKYRNKVLHPLILLDVTFHFQEKKSELK